MTRIPYIQGMDCASLVLPILYDMMANTTQLAERGGQPSIMLSTVSNHLRRFMEMNQQTTECTLFPAIRDLLMNLVLPTEPPMPQQQQQQRVELFFSVITPFSASRSPRAAQKKWDDAMTRYWVAVEEAAATAAAAGGIAEEDVGGGGPGR